MDPTASLEVTIRRRGHGSIVATVLGVSSRRGLVQRARAASTTPRMQASPHAAAVRGPPSSRPSHAGASHDTQHSTEKKVWQTGQTVRIDLRVHPWYGQCATVLGRHGQGLRAELPDGRTCYLPLAWTDQRPRPSPLELNGQAVRLAPEALRSLAEWVHTRADRQKLDVADPEDQKRGDGVADQARARAEAPPVVGQARASRLGRSSDRNGKRGGR